MFDEDKAKEQIEPILTESKDKLEQLKELPDKPESKREEPKVAKPPSLNNEDVYVMPTKFLPDEPAKKKGGATSRIILMAVLLIIFIGAVIYGAIWYLNNQTGEEEEIENIPVVVNEPIQNDNTNIDNTNDDNTNDTNVNDVTNTNDTNTNDIVIIETTDTDNDGLSQEEEVLYSTYADIKDSDRDGFDDGTEIVNLYNPLVPGQSLRTSGLVSQYNNSIYKYSILRPNAWVSSAVGTDTSEINFLSDSETGEFVVVKVEDNTAGQTLNTLKQAFFNGENPDNYSLDGQSALRTDKKVLMVTDEYIYMIIYETSGSSHFATTFEMMLNSFSFLG